MKNVTLRQLTVFDAVARQLNFSRAAQELHLTQPAVSMQIKQLEESAGLPLFEQIGKKIFLTEAGRELAHYSRNVRQQLLDAAEALTELKDVNRGRLHLTIISTAKYFAPAFIAAFCRAHPNVSLRLDVCNREMLLARLARNETDLVIMGHPPHDADLALEPFAPNPHIIIAAPDHPLAQEHHLPLKRIAGERFLIREPGSGTRLLMERVFAARGLTVSASMEIGSDETIKQAVMAGMGIGFLSAHTVQLELQAKRLVSLDVAGFPVVRKWYLVHRNDKRLSPVARAFKHFLLEETATLRHARQTSHRPADTHGVARIPRHAR